MKEEAKNKDFVQIYRRHIDDIARLARENGRAYDLFMLLIKYMDGSNALCVSITALSEIHGTCRRTVNRAVKYLRDQGWICVLKSGNTNVYIVNPEVAWTSYGNQKEYCRFNATVLLSSTENAEYLKNPKAMTHFKTVSQDFIDGVRQKKQEHEKQAKEIREKLKD